MKVFQTILAELEDLFANSLIVVKADIMNQALFYSKELGVLLNYIQ